MIEPNSDERLEIHERCLRDTKNDQLWEAHAEYQGRVGPTVESYSRKSARTKARTAFEASVSERPTHERGVYYFAKVSPATDRPTVYFADDESANVGHLRYTRFLWTARLIAWWKNRA